MFAAGVPLVEALDSVGGASGNSVYKLATDKIQQEVSTGTSLTTAMTNANVFPTMVLQMCAIGEESGSLDHMLGKAADFYEAEVDEMVAGLSSLMEPIIIVSWAPSAASWCRCTCRSSSWARWSDAEPCGCRPPSAACWACSSAAFNVVIHRLPLMMERQWAECRLNGQTPPEQAPFNLLTPRSRCPHCGHRSAGTRTSRCSAIWRCAALRGLPSAHQPALPAGELVTGALFAFCLALGLTAPALPGAVLSRAGGAGLIDWDTTLLPDDLTLPLLWAA
jgi:hypothetical protein